MITIEKIKKQFGNNCIFEQDEKIEIEEGITYLIGSNGSGKTTFLKILLGIIPPEQGSVMYEGNSIRSTLDEIGVVFDQPYFFPFLTGIENLLYFNQISDQRVKINRILDLYRQWNIGNEKTIFKNYSMGMKKKLNIVLSLLHEPKYWFLDEPFNGLDNFSKEKLCSIIEEKKEENRTIIIASHNFESYKLMPDHMLFINRKKILYFPDIGRGEILKSKNTISQMISKMIGEEND